MLKIPCIKAKVHSSDVFYTERDFRDIRELTGTECVEMESFALFHVANVLGKNAACLLTISDSFLCLSTTSDSASTPTRRDNWI